MSRLSRRNLLIAMLGSGALPRLARAATPGTVALDGNLTQGGLVRGQAPAGARITFEETRLRLTPDGRFAFGFGRDHADDAALDIVYADGRKETRSLKVAKREYQIQRIDGLPEQMVTPPPEALERIARDNKLIGAARSRDTDGEGFAGDFRWPVKGPISGVYGSQRILNGEPRRPHFGVDIAAPEGTSIAAPTAAVVAMAEPDMYYTGQTVILDHGHGISTSYLHMSRTDVKIGDVLAQGEVFGAVGKTGRATGPHLCWRLNWFQERLDPQLLAGPMPA